MAKQRMVQTSVWRKSRKFKKLQPLEKLLYLYLITNEDTELCGAYEIDIDEIAMHTGIDHRTLPETFARLEVVGLARYIDGWVIIGNYKALVSNPKVKKGIEDGMSILPKEIRYAMEAFDSLSKDMTDSDSDSDSDTDSDNEYEGGAQSGAIPKAKTPKVTHPELGVPMNETRYNNLVARYGKSVVDGKIQDVIDWQSEKDQWKTKDYAATAGKWLRKDGAKEVVAVSTCSVCGNDYPANFITNGVCRGCGG